MSEYVWKKLEESSSTLETSIENDPWEVSGAAWHASLMFRILRHHNLENSFPSGPILGYLSELPIIFLSPNGEKNVVQQ